MCVRVCDIPVQLPVWSAFLQLPALSLPGLLLCVCVWPHSGIVARRRLPGLLIVCGHMEVQLFKLSGLLFRVATFRYSCLPEPAWPAYCARPHAGTIACLSLPGLPGLLILCVARRRYTVGRMSLSGLLLRVARCVATFRHSCPPEPAWTTYCLWPHDGTPNLRSYYLTLQTIPLFPWAFLITAFMLLLTLPIFSGKSTTQTC